uniref:Uncharacterized protein n=1 Tax=Arundo donax TaxID=35708 RepID=A0A0A8ZTZ2_ARUDO
MWRSRREDAGLRLSCHSVAWDSCFATLKSFWCRGS